MPWALAATAVSISAAAIIIFFILFPLPGCPREAERAAAANVEASSSNLLNQLYWSLVFAAAVFVANLDTDQIRRQGEVEACPVERRPERPERRAVGARVARDAATRDAIAGQISIGTKPIACRVPFGNVA